MVIDKNDNLNKILNLQNDIAKFEKINLKKLGFSFPLLIKKNRLVIF